MNLRWNAQITPHQRRKCANDKADNRRTCEIGKYYATIYHTDSLDDSQCNVTIKRLMKNEIGCFYGNVGWGGRDRTSE